jgi:hypothetical protein
MGLFTYIYGLIHLVLWLLQGSFKAPFLYNSKWACGKNHMLSHHVRSMLKCYGIREPLWIYIHLYQGSFKALQGFFKSSWICRIGVFQMSNKALCIYVSLLYMRGCDKGSQILGHTSSLRVVDLRGLFDLL